jgi:hypothetical protein
VEVNCNVVASVTIGNRISRFRFVASVTAHPPAHLGRVWFDGIMLWKVCWLVKSLPMYLGFYSVIFQFSETFIYCQIIKSQECLISGIHLKILGVLNGKCSNY